MTEGGRRRRVLVFVGTRPEAIKLAPVVFALRAQSERFAVTLCSSSQHGEMLRQALAWFELAPDLDLGVMRAGRGGLAAGEVVAAVLVGANAAVKKARPDWVVVQGDTATAVAGALAGFYADVPVAHVEAGLRSGNRRAPWPEEVNRLLISRLATAHFAVTAGNVAYLRAERVDGDVAAVGNTVLDALLWTRDKLARDAAAAARAAAAVRDGGYAVREGRRFVLVTGHRRESFGEGMRNICRAILALAERYADLDFVYAVHLNPMVRDTVHAMLGGVANVFLLPPLDYAAFVFLMSRCRLILSDSGGIQEEAPSLDKPLVIMREVTERPEVVDCGAAVLGGVGVESIVAAVRGVLDCPDVYGRMGAAVNPFGDGRAGGRIVAALG